MFWLFDIVLERKEQFEYLTIFKCWKLVSHLNTYMYQGTHCGIVVILIYIADILRILHMYNLSIFSTLHSFYVGTMCYTSDIFTRFESTPHRWGITDRSPGPQTYRPSSKSWHETGLFRGEFFVVQKQERVKLFHMIWTIKPLGSKRGKICQTRISDSFGSQTFFSTKDFPEPNVGIPWAWLPGVPVHRGLHRPGLLQRLCGSSHGPRPRCIMVIYGFSWIIMVHDGTFICYHEFNVGKPFFSFNMRFFVQKSSNPTASQSFMVSWWSRLHFCPVCPVCPFFRLSFPNSFSFRSASDTFLRQTPCMVCSRVVYWASGWIQSESFC